jgi:lipopolysaccharide transport system permease protein
MDYNRVAGDAAVVGLSMTFYAGEAGVRRKHRFHALARAIVRPFFDVWQCRELVRVIVWRELSQRFRQSYFGWIWAVFAPLTMLAVYTFVFSKVIDLRGSTQNYALSIFVGMIFFNLFAELAHRAPMLLPEHAQFIKKSIFPLEVLGWTSLLRALTYSGIGLAVFFVFEFMMTGSIPATALLLPLLVIPFCLFLLGSIWLLAALGAFTRDVAFLMITIIPALIFAGVLYGWGRFVHRQARDLHQPVDAFYRNGTGHPADRIAARPAGVSDRMDIRTGRFLWRLWFLHALPESRRRCPLIARFDAPASPSRSRSSRTTTTGSGRSCSAVTRNFMRTTGS